MRRGKAIVRLACILAVATTLGGCGRFKDEANAKFGDQHFKTAVALIELHRVRVGSYPMSLKELRYTGEWDAIALSAVEYERLADGYRLDVVRGWVGAPELSYPPDFWQGLGLKQSNVKRGAPAT
jgi:hypothetical protein